MVLGIAVGGREDDYEVSGVDFEIARRRASSACCTRSSAIWANSNASSGAADRTASARTSPTAPPQLIVGGSVDAAFRRAAEFGDGWIVGGAPPDVLAEGREKLVRRGARRAARASRGRWRSPTSRSATTPRRTPSAYLDDYYAWLGEYARDDRPERRQGRRNGAGSYNQAFAEAGCDELFWIPSSSDREQVDLLAEAGAVEAAERVRLSRASGSARAPSSRSASRSGSSVGGDPGLLERVAVAQGDGAVLGRLAVDGHPPRGADLVLAAVALADRAALVVLGRDPVAERVEDLAGALGHPVASRPAAAPRP